MTTPTDHRPTLTFAEAVRFATAPLPSSRLVDAARREAIRLTGGVPEVGADAAPIVRAAAEQARRGRGSLADAARRQAEQTGRTDRG